MEFIVVEEITTLKNVTHIVTVYYVWNQVVQHLGLFQFFYYN